MGIKLLILPLIMPKLMVRKRLLTRSWSRLYRRRLIRGQNDGIRYSMKPCGLTEWPPHGATKPSPYELVYGHHAVCHGKCNQIQGE
jgi:hypothetical protein